jgi:hypothetical protein
MTRSEYLPVSSHLEHAISERKKVVDASTHFLTESSTCWRDASAILNSGAGDDVLQWLARESEINNRRGAKGVRIAKARSSRASHFGLRVKGSGTTHSLYMPFCALILAGSSRRIRITASQYRTSTDLALHLARRLC